MTSVPSRPPRTGPSRVAPIGAATAVGDLLVWLLAAAVAAIGVADFRAGGVSWWRVVLLGVLIAAGYLAVLTLVAAWRGRLQSGSFTESMTVTVTSVLLCAVATVVVVAATPDGLARAVPLVMAPFAVVGLIGLRMLRRIVTWAGAAPNTEAQRIVVAGAGWVGSTLAQRMLGDPDSPFVPVAFVDDDPGKRNLRIHGVRVLGGFADVTDVLRRTGAGKVVLAVNAADAALVRRVSDAAIAADATALVLPPLSEQLKRSQLKLTALRDVDVADMIGRSPVDTDVQSVAEYITGRRVLVTGAGGSIGSELCRQLHQFAPQELVMLDRDESALHAVELSIYGAGLLERPSIVLADIRDSARLLEVFRAHRPEVVFHAAALKHLPLLERFPAEAYKSNVIGTLNVLTAAQSVGVDHLVNVSTDKAADPTSALGHSKRLAERLTSWFGARNTGRYLSVRFGNVLGSRGSVLHTFAAQIERGGPITVTDRDVTRYFMTIPEACQLVIQAGAIGRPGETLVLDMGEPVKIVDVARRMVAIADADVEIVFTGLRPGEKMHEDLIARDEAGERPFHPLISHIVVDALDPGDLDDQPWVARARQQTVGG